MPASIYYYDQAIFIDPTYTYAIVDLGLFLEDRGLYSEAHERYSYVLANLDPNNLKALVGLLRVMDHLKDRYESLVTVPSLISCLIVLKFVN